MFLFNAALYQQIVINLSRRIGGKKQNNATASLSKKKKKSPCLQEISVINNITNAQRGIICHVMNYKSVKLNQTACMLIISLSAFRHLCDKYLRNIMMCKGCWNTQKQTFTSKLTFLNTIFEFVHVGHYIALNYNNSHLKAL